MLTVEDARRISKEMSSDIVAKSQDKIAEKVSYAESKIMEAIEHNCTFTNVTFDEFEGGLVKRLNTAIVDEIVRRLRFNGFVVDPIAEYAINAIYYNISWAV